MNKKNKLTKKESEISDQIVKNKFKSKSKATKKKYADMASKEIERRKDIRKDERINIRLTHDDLMTLKDFAAREGLPYQTLVSSILHKYLTGSLLDIANVAIIKQIFKS